MGCEKTRELVKEVKLATEEDWKKYAEYLDLILAVKVVGGIEEAIKHINSYGSHHSEAIVTQDYTVGKKVSGRGGCCGDLRQCLYSFYRWRRI